MKQPSAIAPDQFTTFGDLLKFLRRQAGLTQRELSIAVGYSGTQISRLELNQRVPDQATLAARFVPALQIEHEPSWTARLLELAGAARGAEAPAPKADYVPPPPRHNLPLQLTSFVGRKRELGEVKRLLSTARLVTLTGSGGTGKTRLALQAATQLLAAFPDGVWVIELALLADPALVPQAVATTLGLRAEADRPLLSVLTDYLRPKETLLLLDNCEHLVEASARLAEALLHACQNVQILATSRETLGIAGETTFRVPSLATPDPARAIPAEALIQYEAVQLFVERGAAVLPGFCATNENALAIARICRQLDGVPLAIELAAARVRVLRVDQIAARLDDRFRLLTDGSRTALPRQQTLRATIDWSFNLLPEAERVLLGRLAVFAGGWTLDAAEAVCAGEGLEPSDVLDLLVHLADKSLVIVKREQDEEARYDLLETIRQYAREKLFGSQDAAVVRGRHLDYFVRLAEQAEPELTGPDQAAWFSRLEAEMDNVRAALERSEPDRGSTPPHAAGPGPAVAQRLRLLSALWRFCLRQGYGYEYTEKWMQLLTQPEALPRTATRAKALRAGAAMLVGRGEMVRAGPLAEEGLSIYRALGDRTGEAASLSTLGTAIYFTSDQARGRSLVLESLAVYRALNDKPGIAEALIELGQYVDNREHARTRAYLEEALALCRDRKDAIGMGGALDGLGLLALHHGDYAQACRWLEESLAVQRPLGGPRPEVTLGYLGQVAHRTGQYAQAAAYYEASLSNYTETGKLPQGIWVFVNLGYVVLRQGDEARARAIFTEVLPHFQAAGNIIGVVYTLEGLASLAARQGRAKRAVQLYAWADLTRAAVSDTRPPIEQADVDRDLTEMRAQLDEAAMAAALDEGRALTTEQAVACALEAERPT